ncbi:SAM-dependent methyltransferase [Aestuariimicrobium ganziense]|uniref:SAM-dependent methyltransferase n=1 Tax=Aestuariimicrobium ganziense TaxID=2773677 RepID=UPI0019407901|nr:class I SAM-dependent methyltransferase [Aestuariimicrobium ganziense]
MSQQHWDERYRDERYLFGERPNDFLVEAEIMLPRRSRVLVLGDGEGRNGVWLAQQGHDVTTVDLSEVGAAKARRLAESRGVTIEAHVADLAKFVGSPAARGPWDGIVSIFCHLPAALRAEVGRALTPELSARGSLIIESYTPAQIGLGTGGPSDESVLLTRDRVLADWPDLVLDCKVLERRIFEGHGHQGLSAVIQVLGRRPATTPRRGEHADG